MSQNATKSSALNLEQVLIRTKDKREEALKKKQKGWKGAFAALDHIFTGKEQSLLNGIFQNYTSSEPALSTGSIFRGIGFALRNPVHAWNLRKIGTLATDLDFQRELMANPNLWNFAKTNAKTLLPAIVGMADVPGSIFNKGKILDKEAMEKLIPLVEKHTNTISNLAQNIMAREPNTSTLTSDSVALLATTEMQEYIKTKGISIKNYLGELYNANPGISDFIGAMDNVIAGEEKYQALGKLFKIDETLKNKFGEILAQKSLNVQDGEIIRKIQALPELDSIKKVMQPVFYQKFDQLVADLVSQTLKANIQPSLRATLDTYAMSPAILEHAPVLLQKPQHIQMLLSKMTVPAGEELKPLKEQEEAQQERLFGAITSSLDILAADKDLVGILKKEHSILATAATRGSEARLHGYGIKDQQKVKEILDALIPSLLDKPEELKRIIGPIAKGDYIGMTSEILSLIDNPGLKETLKTQSGNFASLLTSAVNHNPDAQKLLISYGISPKDMEPIQEIVATLLPNLLDSPKALGAVLNPYLKGEYPQMSQAILNLLQSNEDLRDALKSNTPALGSLLALTARTPEMMSRIKTYGISPDKITDLASIMPILLDHPKSLAGALPAFQEGNYLGMVTELIKITDDKRVSDYFKEKQQIFAEILSSFVPDTLPALKKNTAILSELVPHIFSHPQILSNMISAYQAENQEELAKQFIELLQTEDVRKHLTNHSALLMEIIGEGTGLDIKDLSSIINLSASSPQFKNQIQQAAKYLDVKPKPDYVGAIIEILKLRQEDPAFRTFIKDHETRLANVISNTMNQIPALNVMTKGIDLSSTTKTLLSNLDGVLKVLEGYHKGGIRGNMQAAVQSLALGVKFIAPVSKDIVASKLVDKIWEAQKNEYMDNMLYMLQARDYPYTSLSEISASVLKSSGDLPNGVSREEAQKKISLLFERASLVGKTDDPINFGDLIIENTSFISSNLKDVSFKNAIFKNAQFHNANIKNIDFTGATIDSQTLTGLMSVKGALDLKGAKILGDISALNIIDVIATGVDISEASCDAKSIRESIANKICDGLKLGGESLEAGKEIIRKQITDALEPIKDKNLSRQILLDPSLYAELTKLYSEKYKDTKKLQNIDSHTLEPMISAYKIKAQMSIQSKNIHNSNAPKGRPVHGNHTARDIGV